MAAPTHAGLRGGASSEPPPIEAIAAAFPHLEIHSLIGTGGMGAVFKARQPRLDRFVALKILPGSLSHDPAFASRFAREGQMLARLNHPNIVTVHDFGEAGGFYFLLMEFVDGVNLRQAMRASRFTPEQALGIVPRICDALQYAHDEGVFHRDIKPENILLDSRGRVKLVDFGIAKLAAEAEALVAAVPSSGPGLTHAGTALGTPEYMAPEQRESPSEVDHRADIYSLGVVFYELLTGELPSGAAFAPPSEKSEADPRVDAIVAQALEKERSRRQRSVAEVRTQIETVAQTASEQVAPGEREARVAPARKGSEEGVPPASSFSRTAMIGPFLLLCLPVFGILTFLVRFRARVPGEPGPWVMVFVFAVAAIGVLVPVLMTILGWVAVGQIRRSGGRIRGLGLAIFNGLLFPLLALNYGISWFIFLFGRGFLGWSETYDPKQDGKLAVISVVLWVVIDLLIIRWVLRATAPAKAAGWRFSFSRGWMLGSCVAVLLLAGAVVATIHHPSARDTDQELAQQPSRLGQLSSGDLLRIGLTSPRIPWSWIEFQRRADEGRLSRAEAGAVIGGLTAWLRRDFPNGYAQPLDWIESMLDHIAKRGLLAEPEEIDFLTALYGVPTCDPLPRLREGVPRFFVTCHLRSPWSHALFGMEFLNEMHLVTIDGRPAAPEQPFRKDWSQNLAYFDLQLPALAPGRHTLGIQVESALIPNADIVGLPMEAPAKDWPPARRKWVRSCEETFEVFAKDAEIVTLTQDPALGAAVERAIQAPKVIIRRQGGRAVATLVFSDVDNLPVSISFRVNLRVAGQDKSCGDLWRKHSLHGQGSPAHGTSELSTSIDPLDPAVTDAEVVLTPNRQAVEAIPGIDRIWGREIVFSHVPLVRQDLP